MKKPVDINKIVAQAKKQLREGNARAKRPAPKRNTFNVGRNDPCPCNSGNKYKKCCLI